MVFIDKVLWLMKEKWRGEIIYKTFGSTAEDKPFMASSCGVFPSAKP